MDAFGNLQKALDFIISQGDIEVKLNLWEAIQKAAEDTQFPSDLQFSEQKELIENCRGVIKWVTEREEQKQLAKLSGDLVRLMVDIEDRKDRDITLI
jgi:hypothetical protein